MDLDDKTILQVNATMMAGILIFLSLSTALFGENIFLDSDNQPDNQTKQPENNDNRRDSIDIPRVIPIFQITITVLLLIPFASSTTTIINGNLASSTDKSSKNYRQLSLKTLRAGFWAVVIGLLLIAILHALTFLIDLLLELYNAIVQSNS